MTETPLSGRLEEWPFAVTAGVLFREKRTGTLTLSSGDKRRQVVFYEGNPVAVLSENPREHVARFLAAKGKITAEEASRLQALPETKESLQSAEFLSKEVMTWGFKFRFVNLAYDLFRWTEGEYSFEEGPPPRNMLLLKVSAPSLLLKGVRHMPAALLERLVPSTMEAGAGPVAPADAGPLGEEETAFLQSCRAGGAVGELVEAAPTETARARELLCVFQALGLITLREPEPVPETVEAPALAETAGEEEEASALQTFGAPPVEEKAPPQEEPAFEIERHSYGEEPAAAGPPPEPAPLFGEEKEEEAPPPLGRETDIDASTPPPHSAEGDSETAAGVPEPTPPGTPPLSQELPPPPWQGEVEASSAGEAGTASPDEAGQSPFAPPGTEAPPPRSVEKIVRARPAAEEPKRRFSFPARLVVILALFAAVAVIAFGYLTGSGLFQSPSSPLPPIPPSEEAGKLEMADNLPVPAIPKGGDAIKEGGMAPSPRTASAPPAPAPVPEPAPSPRADISGSPQTSEGETTGGAYGRALQAYRAGDVDGAASVWKAFLEESGAAYTISVVAACQRATVHEAFTRYGDTRELFVIPLRLSGKSCYRVLLGTYRTAEEARRALDALPLHLRRDLEVRAARGL